MRFFKIALLLLLSLALIGGCAKKKEDAAQLEQELINGDSSLEQPVDTTSEMTPTAPEPEPEQSPQETETQYDMPSQPAGTGYVVQVASCPEEAYAYSLVEKYTARGYQPFVTAITYEGQTYYRVRLGIIENYAEAKALQAELLDKYSENTWIDVTE